MISIELALLAAAVLLLASILASKVSDRLGVPSLLIFLGSGMLAGSDGIGGIQFDDPFIAQTLGVIALAYILFAGGLSTGWTSVRPVLWQGGILSTLGFSSFHRGLQASQAREFSSRRFGCWPPGPLPSLSS